MVQAEEEDSTMVVEDMEEDLTTTAVDPMEMEPSSRPSYKFHPNGDNVEGFQPFQETKEQHARAPTTRQRLQ